MRIFKNFVVFLLVFSIFFGISHAEWFISEITEIGFPKEVEHSDSPVMVVFYSGTFIGKYAKMIDDYAKKRSRIKILKMDRSLNRLTVNKYKIKRNYTFAVFADGELLDKTTNIGTPDDLTEFINHCLEKYSEMREEEKKSEWRPERIKKLEEEKEKEKNKDEDKDNDSNIKDKIKIKDKDDKKEDYMYR